MKSRELQNLLHLETAVIQSIQYAQSTLEEVSQDSGINTQKIKNDAQNFMNSVQKVNEKLLHTINYLADVSTSVPHGGSVYNAEKDFQLAHEQCTIVLDRLNKLSDQSRPRIFMSSSEKNIPMDE